MNEIHMPNYRNMSNKHGGSKEKPKVKITKAIVPMVSNHANSNANQLDINNIFKFMDLYFNRSGIMYNHLYNSFNKLLDEDIKNFLDKSDNTFFEKITKDKVIRYKFEYTNIAVRPPMLPNEDELMFPSDARNRSITYSSKLIATVTQVQEIVDMSTDEVERRVIGQPENEFPIMYIPVMVRSKFCSLSIKKGYDKSEDEYDPGGYFIVYGSEKVVISQERMCENKPLVFLKKDSGAESYVVQVNSKSHRNSRLLQVISIKIKKDNTMSVKVPILSEIPVFILMRALGIESDRDIIDYIVYNEKDLDMVNMVRMSLDGTLNDKGVKIQTQEDAIEYLLTKMRVIKKYSETDKVVKQQQKKLHLMSLLENNFLPHVEGGLLYKAYYIGYMINRLLKCYLGRIPPDDRDSYVNKRVDMIGNLLEELISQHYRKMLNECNKYFKRRNQNDETPLNIINQIKPTIIEQGLRISLMTGSWGRKKGVAQMLQRLSFKQLISFLRRIDSPSVDSSTNKLTGPRQLHPSSLGMCCCLTGDTEILMANGATKQIKDMTNSDNVLSVCPTTLDESNSNIKKWFVKSVAIQQNKPLIKITTELGTVIKCTKDHKLLTIKGLDINDNFYYNFVEAENLKLGTNLIERRLIDFPNSENYILESDKNMYISKIISLELIPCEPVYDFTTISKNHTFIANGIVSHNCVETPEHANVGLVKHLTMLGNISIISNSQINIIKSYLRDKLINIRDVQATKLKNFTKVFLNGEWLGLSEDSFALEDELRYKKLHGTFDSTIGVVHDIKNSEIKIYCDCGRLYRPVMTVNDNIVSLTKELIDKTSDNRSDSNVITDWNEFMIKNPNVIEYIDMEEQPFLMIAPGINDVELMRQTMVSSIDKVNSIKNNTILNRYDDMKFVRYTHCEFHPSLLLGTIATNIPFCNHNAGTRNIFQYSQGPAVRRCSYIIIKNYKKRVLLTAHVIIKVMASLHMI